MEWISVDDRLPEPRAEVLVFYWPALVDVTMYLGDDFDEPWGTPNWRDITHWCPIPEYPSDK